MVTGTSIAQAADTCSNAQYRTGLSAALPDCRAYEQISPVDKNGYAVNMTLGFTGATDDGDTAAFASYSPFPGSPHGMPISLVAHRGATGWTSAINSPKPVTPNYNAITSNTPISAYSADFSVGALSTYQPFDPTDHNELVGSDSAFLGFDVYLRHPDGTLELASRGNGAERLGPFGLATNPYVSADGSRVVFGAGGNLVPEDAGRVSGTDLYARASGHTYLLSALSNGQSSPCGAALPFAPDNDRWTISRDSSHVFFATAAGCSDVARIFVRIGTAPSIEVAASHRATPDPGGPQDATFERATPDGNVVLFKSAEMLTDDAPSGGGYYRFTVSSGDLEFIPAVSGFGYLAMSPDGKRLYYTDAVGGFQYALYEYENGASREIARTVNHPVDGIFEFAEDDDQHAVVLSTVSLDSRDTDGQYDAYAYDIPNGSLTCVSCPSTGPSNDTGRDAVETGRRGISADGRYMVFTATDRLVDGDVNAVADVYQYHDGKVSLITSGRSVARIRLVTQSASGRDVFFGTNDNLVAQDRDGGSADLYDARIGGGFPNPVEPPAVSCAGDACQAASPPTAPMGNAGSETFTGAGNAASPSRPAAQAKARVSAPKTVRGSSARLSVTVPGKGRISVAGSGLSPSSKTTTKAGAYRVTVSLSQRARQRLLRTRRTTVSVTVRFTPAAGKAQASTVRVTFSAPRTSSKGGR